MRIRLAWRREPIWVEFPDDAHVTVALALQSIKENRSDIYEHLIPREGQLLETLTILVNGEHIRYREGLNTELNDGDELHIIPIYAGG